MPIRIHHSTSEQEKRFNFQTPIGPVYKLKAFSPAGDILVPTLHRPPWVYKIGETNKSIVYRPTPNWTDWLLRNPTIPKNTFTLHYTVHSGRPPRLALCLDCGYNALIGEGFCVMCKAKGM